MACSATVKNANAAACTFPVSEGRSGDYFLRIENGKLYLDNAATGEKGAVGFGHDDYFASAAVSPSGRFLAIEGNNEAGDVILIYRLDGALARQFWAGDGTNSEYTRTLVAWVGEGNNERVLAHYDHSFDRGERNVSRSGYILTRPYNGFDDYLTETQARALGCRLPTD